MLRSGPHPDVRDFKGPFDIIGDVHGCVEELQHLLACLGTRTLLQGHGAARRVEFLTWGKRPILFLGDLVDRGPASPDVLRIVMALMRAGQALAVAGNHDVKFLRLLQGQTLPLTHGLELTVEQMQKENEDFQKEVRIFWKNCRLISGWTKSLLLLHMRALKKKCWAPQQARPVSFVCMAKPRGSKTNLVCLYGIIGPQIIGEKLRSFMATRQFWNPHG